MSLDFLTSSFPTTGTLFSAWQAITQAPQPVQAFRSMDRLKWCPMERSNVSQISTLLAGTSWWSKDTTGIMFQSLTSFVLNISRVVSLMISPLPIKVVCNCTHANSCIPEDFSMVTDCTSEKLWYRAYAFTPVCISDFSPTVLP